MITFLWIVIWTLIAANVVAWAFLVFAIYCFDQSDYENRELKTEEESDDNRTTSVEDTITVDKSAGERSYSNYAGRPPLPVF